MKPSTTLFTCPLAAAAIVLALGCEVGEAGDLQDYEVEGAYDEAGLDESTREALDGEADDLVPQQSSSCVVGRFRRVGNAVIGWAINTCYPDRPVQVRLIPKPGAVVENTAYGNTFAIGVSGCINGDSGVISCWGPNSSRLIRRTINGRTYEGYFQYRMYPLAANFILRNEFARVRMTESLFGPALTQQADFGVFETEPPDFGSIVLPGF